MHQIAELNGRRLDPAVVDILRVSAYGHFTSMQVCGGGVRGLDLHLRRLDRGSRVVFGRGLEADRVRDLLHRAVAAATGLTGSGDHSVRITALSGEAAEGDRAEPDVLVTVTPPVPPGSRPPRLRSVEYERVLPEVKHVGTFGLTHHWRQARLAGYDDALFTDRHGRVSEASIWNVCFVEGDLSAGGTVVWPDAPALPGIMMQLIRAGLARAGVRSQTRPVRLADVSAYRSAFLTNSIDPGLAVASIDDVAYAADTDTAADVLRAAYESNPVTAL